MKNDFLIMPPEKIQNESSMSDINTISSNHLFEIYGNKNSWSRFNEMKIFIDGYVIPRHSIHDKYKHLSSHNLISKLIEKFGDEFIYQVKGSFIIIIERNDQIIIYNDIHSIKKFYFYNDGTKLLISNNLKLISSQLILKINEIFPSIQALFQHSVAGQTMFKHVYYSEPGTKLILNTKLSIESYWNPQYLIEKERNINTVEDVIKLFRQVISNYVEYFKTERISLTLTGGRDTRSILAALLNLGLVPHTFTFGFPEGKDVQTSRSISEKLNLPFSNHYIENLNSENYNLLIKEIVLLNNPNIHIHRAHRLDAIKKEVQELGEIEMLFIGAMGGDYIKGVSFNDYIITEFMRRYFYEDIELKMLIEETLSKHYVSFTDILINDLIELIKSLPYMNKENFKNSEFLLSHSFIGSLHDVQDINIFEEYSNYVVAPFMDIDFMECLFQSPFSLFNNDRTSKNPINKLKGGELQANLIYNLYKPLAFIPMANRYKPVDILGNKYLYIARRIYLKLFKEKGFPTFSYEEWFKELSLQKFAESDSTLEKLYNMKDVFTGLSNDQHRTDEGYWHKYSNPIMLSLYLKQLNN